MLPQRNNPVAAPPVPAVPVAAPAAEYSAEERLLLLGIARQAIVSALRGAAWEPASPSPHLAEARGVFTSLHVGERLRGCVGFVQPLRTLYQTVAQTAVAAAFNDPRFDPVSEQEAAQLRIEISVLSPLRAITLPEIEVGCHGLVITHRFQRGLLLPQVAAQHAWDRETFVMETCLKAGLAPDAWRHGATLEAFTAEVFGDETAVSNK